MPWHNETARMPLIRSLTEPGVQQSNSARLAAQQVSDILLSPYLQLYVYKYKSLHPAFAWVLGIRSQTFNLQGKHFTEPSAQILREDIL